MKTTKTIIAYIGLSLLALSQSFSQTNAHSGFAVQGGDDILDGWTSIVIIDTVDAGFGAFSNLNPGLDLVDGSWIDDFAIVGTGTTFNAGGPIWASGNASYSRVDGITQGDNFAVAVFQNSTSETLEGDNFWLWTASNWEVLGDGTWEHPTHYDIVSGESNFTGTVIPEPSTYAAIFGLGVLGFVVLRRKFTK
ncbi:MAG: PEP-CTERM sorting domain-containing protein [Opitutales bacterium]|nr:PEP-CTERM sorting domain-containing protein [Opitutales bacterium]